MKQGVGSIYNGVACGNVKFLDTGVSLDINKTPPIVGLCMKQQCIEELFVKWLLCLLSYRILPVDINFCNVICLWVETQRVLTRCVASADGREIAVIVTELWCVDRCRTVIAKFMLIVKKQMLVINFSTVLFRFHV